MLTIDTDFESGNLVVHKITENKIIGEIRKDTNHKDFQWFYFSIKSPCNKIVEVKIKHINLSSYPSAWYGYQVSVRNERESEWQRVNTHIIDDILVFSLNIKKDKVFVAYFPPYTLKQHQLLSQRFSDLAIFHQKFQVETLNKHTIECFHLATKYLYSNQKNIWIIARQHPGESIVGWFMEAVAALFEIDKWLVAQLLERYQFFIVHNANPDGVAIGTHRCNAHGSDLNRNWQYLSSQTCPEIVAIRKWMQGHPPSLFLDIHGDERTLFPYILANPATLIDADRLLLERMRERTPDLEIRFQSVNEIDLSIGRHYVNHQFNSLALTLEMPCQYHEHLQLQSPSDLIENVKKLAHTCLRALLPY